MFGFCYRISMNNPPLTLTVRTEFFAPLTDALKRSTHTRLCSEYSDEQHLQSGIGRVIDHCVSGREWVQRSWMKFSQWVSVGTFFAALRSPRRLRMVEEVAWDVYAQVHRLVLQTTMILWPCTPNSMAFPYSPLMDTPMRPVLTKSRGLKKSDRSLTSTH